MADDALGGTEELTASDCWALLRTAEIGRLAVVFDGAVDIFPINYVVDHGSVVFRTGEGSKLAGALSGAAVAFEADGYDDRQQRAWSVVIKGPAAQLRSIDDIMASTLLPLFPWEAGAKPHFIRVVPDQLTGRRFRPASAVRRGPDLGHKSRLNVE